MKWPMPPSHRMLRVANMAVAIVAMVMAMNADHRWSAMLLSFVCGFNLSAAIACTIYIGMQDSFRNLLKAFRAMSAINDQLIAGKMQIIHDGGDPNEYPRPSLH